MRLFKVEASGSEADALQALHPATFFQVGQGPSSSAGKERDRLQMLLRQLEALTESFGRKQGRASNRVARNSRLSRQGDRGRR